MLGYLRLVCKILTEFKKPLVNAVKPGQVFFQTIRPDRSVNLEIDVPMGVRCHNLGEVDRNKIYKGNLCLIEE